MVIFDRLEPSRQFSLLARGSDSRDFSERIEFIDVYGVLRGT